MNGPPAGLRILVVEDEALIAVLIADILEELGCRVVGVADTTARAIELARDERPELVLCDVKLLDGDSGLDVAAALKPLEIPCLLVSGNCPTREVASGIALGCLKKPFNPTAMIRAIDTALRRAAGRPLETVPTGMIVY